MNTKVTTRFLTGVESAHGIIYDPFSNMITLFGAGKTGTVALGSHTFKQSAVDFNADFDQGAVDGLGHAFIAGNNQITFLDYSISGDITAPNYVEIETGFTNIDDVAPLVGAGSQQGVVPEPASVVLLLTGGLGMLGYVRRRKQAGATD
jgi:hypothetical protein